MVAHQWLHARYKNILGNNQSCFDIGVLLGRCSYEKKKKKEKKKGEKSKADEKRRGEDWERTKERQNQATGENEVRMKIA